MRVLVEENVAPLALPAAAGSETVSILVKSLVIRPRVEGEEGVLRGAALAAKLADRGVVVFTLRPAEASAALAIVLLNQIQAFITFFPIPLLGSNINDAGVTSFPFPEVDVTGDLVLFRGRLVFDLQSLGVVGAQLRLVNRAAADTTVLLTQQIFADPRTLQLQQEKAGVLEP